MKSIININFDKINILIKSVTSNLLRAQREEHNVKDRTERNYFLDKASADSVYLAKLLLENGDNQESSRYFLSAAYSYERAGAFVQSKACYDRLLEIGVPEYIEKAKKGLISLSSLKKDDLDLTSKEGKITALDFLIWKHNWATTTKAKAYLYEEFGLDISTGSIRLYANELKERRRVVIWGGPQGREYHIFPNMADLATRAQHYGKRSLFEGSIESRITDDFAIDFNKLIYNKEMFILNERIKPKMIMVVDEEGFVQNLDKFTANGYPMIAKGVLRQFSYLKDNGTEIQDNSNYNGHRTTRKDMLDVLDSEVLADGNTGEVIYEKETTGDN